MDRAKELTIWRRSVAVGVVALVLSVGGQLASRRAAPEVCPVSQPVADRVLSRLANDVSAPAVVQHLVHAALSLVSERCE